MPNLLPTADDPFEALLRYYFGDKPLTRVRVNIMSAGYVVQGVAVTRALLHRIVELAKQRQDILTISSINHGVLGFARELEVESNDLWAHLVLSPDAPPFKRAAAVVCPVGEYGPMIVGIMLTDLSRPEILSLNVKRRP